MVKLKYVTNEFRLKITDNEGNFAPPTPSDLDNVIQFDNDSQKTDEEIVDEANLNLNWQEEPENVKKVYEALSRLLKRKYGNSSSSTSPTPDNNNFQNIMNESTSPSISNSSSPTPDNSNLQYTMNEPDLHSISSPSSQNFSFCDTPYNNYFQNMMIESNKLGLQSTSHSISSSSFSSTSSPNTDNRNLQCTMNESETLPSLQNFAFDCDDVSTPYNDCFQKMMNESNKLCLQSTSPTPDDSNSESETLPSPQNFVYGYFPTPYNNFSQNMIVMQATSHSISSSSFSSTSSTPDNSILPDMNATSPSISQPSQFPFYPTPEDRNLQYEPDISLESTLPPSISDSSQQHQSTFYPTPPLFEFDDYLSNSEVDSMFPPLELIQSTNTSHISDFHQSTNTSNISDFHQTLSNQDQMSDDSETFLSLNIDTLLFE
ncbi:3142_t:CDS:2 [Funneliformis mosseae]|uniref:3142_t:CDS:1 n=1 Tax=Funneliformis mosseae TaxID=27381 RepID=A0A9N8Z9C3_FUNMO|nr:3142_t:CDS:2 [Funneliformis mosseae]